MYVCADSVEKRVGAVFYVEWTRCSRVTRSHLCTGDRRPRGHRLSDAARRVPLCPLRGRRVQLRPRHLLPGDGRQAARQHQLVRQLHHLLPAQSQVPPSTPGGRHVPAVTHRGRRSGLVIAAWPRLSDDRPLGMERYVKAVRHLPANTMKRQRQTSAPCGLTAF